MVTFTHLATHMMVLIQTQHFCLLQNMTIKQTTKTLNELECK